MTIARNPDGSVLTLADLPAPGARFRWTAYRKTQLMTALRHGLLTLSDARARYALSEEEFKEWHTLDAKGGLRALRATHAADYRYAVS